MYSPVISGLSTPSSDKMNVSPTPSKAVNEIYSFIDQLNSDKKRSKNILSKIDSITGNILYMINSHLHILILLTQPSWCYW